MKTWIVAGAALFALFLLGALFAGGVGYVLLASPARPRAAQFNPASKPGTLGARTTALSGKFPPPPSKDGSIVERWDGCYYYSTGTFEAAVAQNAQRTRFWFDVRRTAKGDFTATCNENSGLGAATIRGTFNPATNALVFDKRYAAQPVDWRYEGNWVPDRARIEGQWGGGQGGFVLFPRRLKDSEIAIFEQPQPLNAIPTILPPTPKPPQPNDEF